MISGRLPVTPSTGCLLASYAIQSEIGDYNSEEHDEQGHYLKYLSNFPYIEPLLKNGEDCLKKIVHLHKLHKGQTPAVSSIICLKALEISKQGFKFLSTGC